MSICKLYVVRHGESEHNRDEIVSGQVDPDLTSAGIQQALAARKRLAAVHFDEVYSSDLQRAVKTAELISGRPVPLAHQLMALRERNFGELDGKPNHHLQKALVQHAAEHAPLTHDKRWQSKLVPGMESDAEVAERFIAGLTEIAQANMGKTVLVAAHGGTLRMALIGLKHGAYDDFPPGSVKNASFIELSYDGHTLRVDSSADTHV